MRLGVIAGGVILVVLLLAGGYYFFVYEGAPEKPGEATAVTEPATAEPEAPPSAEEAQDPSVPTFSVVRVDKDGSTVAAGRALPGADVQVKANGIHSLTVLLTWMLYITLVMQLTKLVLV